jgi:membrane-bound lytic murein transglycosylase B
LGEYLGDKNVLHVYFSLLQADHPEAVNALILMAQKKQNTGRLDPAVIKKINDNAVRKAQWAADQFNAIHDILSSQKMNIADTKGSYSGAFGLVQFIPDSYLKWAIAADNSQKPDLFSSDDASMSVGNYLKVHGWVPNDKKSHFDALFSYNNSTAYVNKILDLAKLL